MIMNKVKNFFNHNKKTMQMMIVNNNKYVKGKFLNKKWPIDRKK